MAVSVQQQVLTVADVDSDDLVDLLRRYELDLVIQEDAAPITGSFWGEPEAGIVGSTVYVRGDTPIHSLLHESCHVICMTAERRARLVRDAGGDDLEEAGVCYLQVVLADCLPACGSGRLMLDMDAWGYSFRLGSTKGWFRNDAEDAQKFLTNQGVLTKEGLPSFKLRR